MTKAAGEQAAARPRGETPEESPKKREREKEKNKLLLLRTDTVPLARDLSVQ